jgi:hypothetical protein
LSFDGEEVMSGGAFLSVEEVSVGVCSSPPISISSSTMMGDIQEELFISSPLLSSTPTEGEIVQEVSEVNSASGIDNIQEELFLSSPLSSSTPTQGEMIEEVSEANSASEKCIPIDLKLKTDKYPEETRFQLVDVMSSAESRRRIWSYLGFQASKEYQFSTCEDPAGCYIFTITDSFADG